LISLLFFGNDANRTTVPRFRTSKIACSCGHVGPQPIGLAHDARREVVLQRVEQHVTAEPAGPRKTFGIDLGQDDLAGTERPSNTGVHQPQGACAQDQDRVALFEVALS
jgi:hypothetical protein